MSKKIKDKCSCGNTAGDHDTCSNCDAKICDECDMLAARLGGDDVLCPSCMEDYNIAFSDEDSMEEFSDEEGSND